MTTTEERPTYREIADAVIRARQLYCQPVADLITEELMAWSNIGHPIGGHGRIQRLVDAVMAEPDAETPGAENLRASSPAQHALSAREPSSQSASVHPPVL